MINIPIEYAYLALSLATVLVWILCFLLNAAGRRRQVVLSVLFSVAGAFSELLYIPDYWHPNTIWQLYLNSRSYISLEDFIFAFAVMGIMSSLPDAILRRAQISLPTTIAPSAIVQMLANLAAVGLVSVGLWLAGINSIFATSAAMICASSAILLVRGSWFLLKLSLMSALAMLAAMFVIYWIGFFFVADSEAILKATWSLYGTSFGIRVLRVPLPELVWAFSFGSFFSLLFQTDRFNRITKGS